MILKQNVDVNNVIKSRQLKCRHMGMVGCAVYYITCWHDCC